MAAEALLGIVIQNLTTFVQQELATFYGVHSHIQKLTGYLTTIHAVLQDAEEKQITSHAVKLWLQKLTDAAHVLDDVLDDCSIQLGRQNNSEFATFPASACLTTHLNPNNILFRLKIGMRMKKITERFHAINEERRTFELRTGIITERQPQDDDDDDNEWRQTTSVITEPIVYGRDQDREKIVDFLLSQATENEELSIYPIVGMGGIGKTTLAQLVFNDQRLTPHFDLKIWVCVPDNFTIMRILQSILESIAPQNPKLSILESLQKEVQELLRSKRYLLVLDDVWSEDPVRWIKLKSLLKCGGGTKGASILVTTRLENVASIMGTYPAHRLIGLSDDDNWLLFEHHAFRSDKEEHEKEKLVAIGKEIVKKCVGSPLASKALGSLLCTKREEKQWLRVNESKFWDIPEDNYVMRALRLSYFNLKLSLRRCFSFCAIFPKDKVIAKEQLIYLWMANEFISSRGNLAVEEVGNEVWNELYQRSFFQEVKIDVFGGITFKIHDLFHDLAQSIMGEECAVFKAANLTNFSGRVHHVCCLDSNQSINTAALKKVESLRTFLEIDESVFLNATLPRVPTISSLRALRISVYQLSALKNLTHLRYLNIYGSHITTLPKSICRLQKLQILKLEDCDNLYCLPKHLTQLQDLRHLVISGCDSLVMMPPNIGKLKCLKTLSTFIVGSKKGFGLEELHDLQLGGKLHIKGLENVNSESDAKQANLIGKEDLNQLYFWWDDNANSRKSDYERVLEALQPHSNLKSLGLNGYRGKQFSSWMRNPSILQGLVHVILFECTNCEQLPPLGKLPLLTTLDVSGMKAVKHLDDDSYDDDVSVIPFKSLKKLTLSWLPNFEKILRDERVEMLPLLSHLIINDVPKLKLSCLLSSVEHLEVQNIEDAASFSEGILQNTPHLKFLFIGSSSNMELLPNGVGSLNALEELQIMFCDRLESFPEHVLQGLTLLRKLDIYNCPELKSLSIGEGHLSCLEHLRITDCPQFVSLPCNMNHLTALHYVEISGFHQLPEGLQGIPFLKRLTLISCSADSLPEWLGDLTSLQELDIFFCLKLRSLPSSFSQLTSLQELAISACPELESLPNSFQQLRNLQRLDIYLCRKIEKRCKRETGEDWHNIAHIPLFQILTKAEQMTYSDKFISMQKGYQLDLVFTSFTSKINKL